MFKSASKFNQPIDQWTTSKVNDMQQMFQSASAFNQPIGKWDTSSVTNMYRMFVSIAEFNETYWELEHGKSDEHEGNV